MFAFLSDSVRFKSLFSFDDWSICDPTFETLSRAVEYSFTVCNILAPIPSFKFNLAPPIA